MAFSYTQYQESERLRRLAEEMARHNEGKPSQWTGGQYGQQRDDALSKLLNREKFSYDVNGDALYQQYKDKYVQQGKQAMQDTMGQAAALTGGYGSTYGQAVGQQQYNAYLQKLGDVVPELYQLAMNRYQMEGDELKDQYAMAKDLYDTEYGQYRDTVSDWMNERSYLADRYDNERSYDYGVWSDGRDFSYKDYRDRISDDQWMQEQEESNRRWQAEFDENKRQFDENMAWQQAKAAASRGGGGGGGGSREEKDDSSKYADRHGTSGNLISVPGYGEISYDDAEALEKRGHIKLIGVDKRGKPIYAKTTKKNYNNPIRMSR